MRLDCVVSSKILSDDSANDNSSNGSCDTNSCVEDCSCVFWQSVYLLKVGWKPVLDASHYQEQSSQTEADIPELLVAYQLVQVLTKALVLHFFFFQNLVSFSEVWRRLDEFFLVQNAVKWLILLGVLCLHYDFFGSLKALTLESSSVFNVDVPWGCDQEAANAWKQGHGLNVERPLPREVLVHVEGQGVTGHHSKGTSQQQDGHQGWLWLFWAHSVSPDWRINAHEHLEETNPESEEAWN